MLLRPMMASFALGSQWLQLTLSRMALFTALSQQRLDRSCHPSVDPFASLYIGWVSSDPAPNWFYARAACLGA